MWKADEEAYNAGRHISDAEFLIWMATIRLHLTADETALFDDSSTFSSIEDFRAEKAAALARILWNRHGFHVAKLTGALKAVS